MLGQSLYIKSRGPGQLTLGLGRWEVTREVGVGRVYAGLRRAGERGNVCVCLCCRDRAGMFVSACCQNVRGGSADPLWQGLYTTSEELC